MALTNPVQDPAVPVARFAYLSLRRDGLEDSDLVSLVRQSWSNNTRHGINGLLDFESGTFRQVVEGHPRDILRLVSLILTDPRHHQIEVVEYSIVERAQYSDWAVSGFERFWGDANPIPKLRVSNANVIFTDIFGRDRKRLPALRGGAGAHTGDA